MKKNIFSVILLILVCNLCFGQTKKEHRERIKSLKVAFLTQELDLTAEVAQKFWPVYNKHEENLQLLRNSRVKRIKKRLKEKGNFENFSENEAKKLVTSKLLIEQKVVEENKDFVSKLAVFLSYKKILKLQVSEREFIRELMHKFRGNKR